MGKTSAFLPSISNIYLGTGSSEGDVNQGQEQDQGANDRSRDQNDNGSSTGKKIATMTNITVPQLRNQLKALGINPASVGMMTRGNNVQIKATPQTLQQIQNLAGQNRFNPGIQTGYVAPYQASSGEMCALRRKTERYGFIFRRVIFSSPRSFPPGNGDEGSCSSRSFRAFLWLEFA